MRSVVLNVLAAGLLVAGCDSSARQPAHVAAPTVALNHEVDVDSFAFTVTAVELAQPKIGYLTAQGTFVVVDMTVRNIGDGLRTVYCQNQNLKDLAGRTYDLFLKKGVISKDGKLPLQHVENYLKLSQDGRAAMDPKKFVDFSYLESAQK